jgi:hypothetical protein
MNDQELRAMIRDSIAKHLGLSDPASTASPSMSGAPLHLHASHGLLPVARGSEGDGACLIEPSVRCSHCGYCVSYGH